QPIETVRQAGATYDVALTNRDGHADGECGVVVDGPAHRVVSGWHAGVDVDRVVRIDGGVGRGCRGEPVGDGSAPDAEHGGAFAQPDRHPAVGERRRLDGPGPVAGLAFGCGELGRNAAHPLPVD